MQSLFLTLYKRIILWNIVGAHSAPSLMDAAVFVRIIEKLRLTDKETIDTEFSSDGQGGVAWKTPKVGYGDATIEFENTEAEALARAIEGQKSVRVMDAEWMLALVEQYKAKEKKDETPTPLKGKDADAGNNANLGSRKARPSVR